jgi:ABC-type phosphate transport system substrate-binding protein
MYLNTNVKTIKINGIEPNSETIASRKYPAITEVFVVTLKGIAEDSPAAKLRDFLLSAEGQQLVYESGHARIKP